MLIDEIRAGSTSWDNQRTVRDYLLVDLFTGNAQRTCVGETATLSEYEERKEVDGKIMLKVSHFLFILIIYLFQATERKKSIHKIAHTIPNFKWLIVFASGSINDLHYLGIEETVDILSALSMFILKGAI